MLQVRTLEPRSGVLQALAILSTEDIKSRGHNTPNYVHYVVEAMKLAFADREQYYGDPPAAEVPLQAMLSAEYARVRARLIDPLRANPELRPRKSAQWRGLAPGRRASRRQELGTGNGSRQRHRPPRKSAGLQSQRRLQSGPHRRFHSSASH